MRLTGIDADSYLDEFVRSMGNDKVDNSLLEVQRHTGHFAGMLVTISDWQAGGDLD
jgi:hypothetical protein